MTEDERDAYLERGFNNYSPDQDRERFLDDLEVLRKRIEKALADRWTPGFAGDGDFSVCSDDSSRLLWIEVTQERALHPEMVTLVHSMVKGTTAAYSVDICNSMVFLEWEDGVKVPDFNVFIEAEQIWIYCPDEKVRTKFGFHVE